MPLVTIANRRPMQFLLVFSDLIGLVFVFNLVYWLRLGYLRPDFLLAYDLVYIFITTLSVFYIFFMYSPNSRVLGMRTTLRSFFSVFILGVTIALGIYLFGGQASKQYGRGVLIGSLLVFSFWVVISRFIMDRWSKAQGHRLRWLFLGTPEVLEKIWAENKRFPIEGSMFFLTEDGTSFGNVPISGKWSDLTKISEGRDLSGVIIATKSAMDEKLSEQLLHLRLDGTKVYSLINFYEDIWQKMPIYFMDRSWITFADGFALIHNPIGLRVKRILDIVLSLLLIPIAVPLVLISGLFIFIEGGGPVIYRQIRTGLQGKEFNLLKLRTMRKDAESNGAQWAQVGDSRITRVGSLLRKTRLDELPQLWNVLMGDMSFIGPRPERPEFNKELEEWIPHYSLRHVVRPGITGWAQVLYQYGASREDAQEKLQYDLFYIKDYSLLLDVVIFFRTIRIVLFGAGR